MKRWLTSAFLFLALAGSVLAGTPLHSGKMSGEIMDCCEKAKSLQQTPEAEMARVCCAINCTDSAPTSPGASSNFSPANICISDSIIKQIALFLSQKSKPVSTTDARLEREILPRKIPPKYIQNHSILI